MEDLDLAGNREAGIGRKWHEIQPGEAQLRDRGLLQCLPVSRKDFSPPSRKYFEEMHNLRDEKDPTDTLIHFICEEEKFQLSPQTVQFRALH